jgi:hypothetical protein
MPVASTGVYVATEIGAMHLRFQAAVFLWNVMTAAAH